MAVLPREAVQGMALLTFDSSARVPADSPVRDAVKDVAVSGRFVHQWELLREAIAALAAECLVSLPTEVGGSDSDSPCAAAARPDAVAPIDELMADVDVTKDCTQDGVAPADVVPLIQSLPAAPFTLQRLCEVVTARGVGGYKSRPKLAYALHRLASVSSTLQPVAVEDRWAPDCSGDDGCGDGQSLRRWRPRVGDDQDELGDDAELEAGAAAAARIADQVDSGVARAASGDGAVAGAGPLEEGDRHGSAKRPRDDDDEAASGVAAPTAGGEGDASAASSAQAGASGGDVPAAVEAEAAQSPAKRPRPAQ